MTILDDFDDIQHQTVFQNGRWSRFCSWSYTVWGNLVTIFRVYLTEYVVKQLFMTILDDFDHIQNQTVFQNGRCPRFGSCPYTVLRQFGHYISSKFDWICCKIVVYDNTRWFWWYSTPNSVSKWPLATFRYLFIYGSEAIWSLYFEYIWLNML